MSAGARTTTSLYDDDLPTDLRLEPNGRISSWAEIVRRARERARDVDPGLLATALRTAGWRVGYAGPRASRNREAAVAADRSGKVERVSLVRAGRSRRRGARLVAQHRRAGRQAAPGPSGIGQLREIVGARRPQDVVIVIQDPSPITRRLLAIGAAGVPGGGKALHSDSTRTAGVVSSTDVAPTVLRQFDVDVPDDMSGKPIEARGNVSPADLSELRNRLTDLGPRRWGVIWLGLIGALLIAGSSESPDATRACRRRALLLAAMWLPSVLLVTGALAPTAPVETLIVAAACAALALATDRIRPWPRALVVPAAVTVGVHVADLAFGSESCAARCWALTQCWGRASSGSATRSRSRSRSSDCSDWAAALATAPPRTRVWGFAVGGGVLAFTLSWGRLGADVGASRPWSPARPWPRSRPPATSRGSGASRSC